MPSHSPKTTYLRITDRRGVTTSITELEVSNWLTVLKDLPRIVGIQYTLHTYATRSAPSKYYLMNLLVGKFYPLATQYFPQVLGTNEIRTTPTFTSGADKRLPPEKDTSDDTTTPNE